MMWTASLLSVFIFYFQACLAVDLTGCMPGPPNVIMAIKKLQGDIYSPGYLEGQKYMNNLLCQYTVIAPIGYRILITFNDLELENFHFCDKDALTIHEGSNAQAPVRGIFCGNKVPRPIISSENVLHFVFKTDPFKGMKGFHLHFKVEVAYSVCPTDAFQCKNRNCVKWKTKCNGIDECEDGSDEELCKLYPPPPSITCGIQPAASTSSSDVERVVGGGVAGIGSWPWQVSLELIDYEPSGHMCGGTLINAQWVVTAAHCFLWQLNPPMWRVRLGSHDMFSRDTHEQVRNVDMIFIYDEQTDAAVQPNGTFDLHHDIALVKLRAPVQFTDYVRPACVPTTRFPIGTKCIATGWGMTRGTGFSGQLKEVEFWIENPEVCYGQFGHINGNTSICVRHRSSYQDVCHGDSGGPLVCEKNDKWYVAGATSRGTATNKLVGLCGLPDTATVFSSTAAKSSWIQQTISKYS